MAHSASTAFLTFIVPLTSFRALRLSLLLLVGLVGLIGIALLVGFLDEDATRAMLSGLRAFVVFPGVPVASILLSEMSLRDGIRHRTLLYPLLGPVSRVTCALVRTLATGAIVAVGGCLALCLVEVFLRDGGIGRELTAIALGAFTYVGVFGLVHLLTERGLVAGLAVLALIDYPLGLLPLGIRNLSPSHHLKVVAGIDTMIQLPIAIGTPSRSPALSAFLLVVLFAAFVAVTALVFRRKDLGVLS